MTTLTVTIDKTSNARDIMQYLKSLDCVKNVSVMNKTKDLHNSFALSGKPATDDELEHLIAEMQNDPNEGISTTQLLANVKRWKKKYV